MPSAIHCMVEGIITDGNVIKLGIIVQSIKELIIATFINLCQLDNYTGADIQFARFVFGIGGASYITAAALQFSTQFFLRQFGILAQAAYSDIEFTELVQF